MSAVAARSAARAVARSVLGSRCIRWALGVSVVYVAMDLVFSLEMGARGLLSPEGSVHLDAVALGVACLAVRVVSRFPVPALLGFGLAGVGLEAVLRARRSS